MSQKVAGTCYVKADGVQFVVEGGVECPLFGVKRETVVPGYYKEEDQTPYVKLTAVFTRDFPLEKLESADNMTVTAELKNGKTYVLTGAYVVGESSVKSDEGKSEIEFNGAKGYWQ